MIISFSIEIVERISKVLLIKKNKPTFLNSFDIKIPGYKNPEFLVVKFYSFKNFTLLKILLAIFLPCSSLLILVAR